MICLVTGGAGCGKSTWAEKLVSSLPRSNRFYIATMQVYDEESRQRVIRHRIQRADKGFTTIECEKKLSAAQVPQGSIVLLEDLVNLTANEMFDGGNAASIIPALTGLAQRCSHLVMVTNDVFADGVAYTGSMTDYLETLARVNQAAAQLADTVIEVVYSIPVPLKGEVPCL